MIEADELRADIDDPEVICLAGVAFLNLRERMFNSL